jgi:fatty-acyl-CoA synthase
MFGVPAMFLFMSQVPEFEAADLSSLRYLICGGAPVPETLITRYGQRGIAFVQGYGLTETSPLALVLRTEEVSVKVGAAGHAVLPLSDVRLVDAQNNAVAPGQRGEICVRGPQVMAGYWGRPDETALVMLDGGWLRTGDVGHIDANGYIFIEDRKKDVIVVSGFKVYPNEIEDVAAAQRGVREVAAVGVPDKQSGEAVKLFIVRSDPKLTEADVIAHARANLTGYKVPRHVEFLDELPKSNVGKVLRRSLKARS